MSTINEIIEEAVPIVKAWSEIEQTPKEIADFLGKLQEIVVAKTDPKLIVPKLQQHPSNKPTIFPDTKPGQGYGVVIKIKPDGEISVLFTSSPGEGKVKLNDEVQKAFGGDILDHGTLTTKGSVLNMLIPKALRALYYEVMNPEFKPASLAHFLGAAGLSSGCASITHPDGTIEVSAATAFQPNRTAEEFLDLQFGTADHGLVSELKPYTYSGLMDAWQAQQLLELSVSLMDVVAQFKNVPALNPH